MELIKSVIFFLLLLTASISDIKKREVNDSISIMIAITALIGTSLNQIPYMLLSSFLITLPQLLIAVIKPNSYGGADIKIMAACSFLLGLERGFVAIIIGLTLAVFVTSISRKIKKKDLNESFVLVPYLAVGSLLGYIIC